MPVAGLWEVAAPLPMFVRVAGLMGAPAAPWGEGKDLGITVLVARYFVISDCHCHFLSDEDCRGSDNCPSFQKRLK